VRHVVDDRAYLGGVQRAPLNLGAHGVETVGAGAGVMVTKLRPARRSGGSGVGETISSDDQPSSVRINVASRTFELQRSSTRLKPLKPRAQRGGPAEITTTFSRRYPGDAPDFSCGRGVSIAVMPQVHGRKSHFQIESYSVRNIAEVIDMDHKLPSLQAARRRCGAAHRRHHKPVSSRERGGSRLLPPPTMEHSRIIVSVPNIHCRVL